MPKIMPKKPHVHLTKIPGTLEVDHDRGVIYFHIDTMEEMQERGTVTCLRICGLPTPIPRLRDRMLDITHMHGCDWKGD